MRRQVEILILQRLLAGFLLVLVQVTANAALHGRKPLTPGGTDYRAYYDDVQNVTWAADANLAQTSGYSSGGLMFLSQARIWINSLITQNHGLGYLDATDWRLPTTTDTGSPGCNNAYVGTDCGFNSLTGEMGRLYYNPYPASGLGNAGMFDTSGAPTGCGLEGCLTNQGPFINIQTNHGYWSGTEYPPALAAWTFHFGRGEQGLAALSIAVAYAWAVRTGDFPPVPDTDGDGVANDVDNCTFVSNSSQLDADGDGYGNACDGDLNNNGLTNAQDYVIFRTKLGTTDAAADLNGNNIVNAQDYVLFRALLGSAPGPSAFHP